MHVVAVKSVFRVVVNSLNLFVIRQTIKKKKEKCGKVNMSDGLKMIEEGIEIEKEDNVNMCMCMDGGYVRVTVTVHVYVCVCVCVV